MASNRLQDKIKLMCSEKEVAILVSHVILPIPIRVIRLHHIPMVKTIVFANIITGWAVAQTCCISHGSKYRKRGNFDHPCMGAKPLNRSTRNLD